MYKLKKNILSLLFIFAATFSLQFCNSKSEGKAEAKTEPEPAKPALQILEPIKWNFTSKPAGDGEFLLIMEAKLDKNWHLYSQHVEEGGPVPTQFTFEEGPYQLVGEADEQGHLENEYDPNFDMKLSWFSDSVRFVQKVTSGEQTFTVTGSVEFMVCDPSRCLPPETVEFSIPVKAKKGVKIIPAETPPDTAKEDTSGKAEIPASPDTASLQEPGQAATVCEQINKDVITQNEDKNPLTFWTIFIAGFLSGFLALLTPCVFPMIPLTVSFFTKRSGDRKKGVANALLYGFSIIVIYVALGFIVTKLFGSDALNAMASNAWFNLAFFIIFVIFAISFFGAFEITLPNAWVNKADAVSERGGLIGIFFMAFTLALVSFSCTGPIIGTLLVEAAVSGHNAGPVVGMSGFALALALPFGLFAAFPGWLNSLPKSGGWLNSVKVSLGFLELALALKFLSVVDLAYHWDFLKREIFLAFWIVIFALWGFYLLGKLRFSHDSEITHISVPRLFFAILAFVFATYMIPGLWGAPLKLLSGLQPPLFYTIWENREGAESTEGHCPHGINCFHDYQEGLAHAKEVKKPIMIDFTGWSCVNCRKMEENVWIDPRIKNMLKEDYVLISLYVDDKTKLPEDEQFVSSFSGKKVTTIGEKWSDFEASCFNANTQPLYILLTPEEVLLNEPIGYTPDVEEYLQFLKEGLKKFEKVRK